MSAIERFHESRVSMWAPGETLSALGLDSLDEVQLRCVLFSFCASFVSILLSLPSVALRRRSHCAYSVILDSSHPPVSRGDFVREWSDVPVSLSLFSVPNQTLGELATALEALVSAAAAAK